MTARVLVLGAHVPYARGGAENLNAGLVAAIRDHAPDVLVDLVQIPFKAYPDAGLVAQVMSWRLADLAEVDGKPVDLVIATKFPTYAARHRNKVLWLVHQHRQCYELEGGAFDTAVLTDVDRAARAKVRELDTRFIGECNARYAISETVAQRLQQYNGLASTPLWPPSLLQERITAGPCGDTILYFGRLERIKRPDLLLHAARLAPRARLVFCGSGHEEARLRALAHELGLDGRCRFAGHVSADELVTAIRSARAVFYAPHEEDYGFATIEAFLGGKCVVTCTDSGEVARIVTRTGSGWVVPPQPAAIAHALDAIYAAPNFALETLAVRGKAFARQLEWRHVVDTLVLAHL
jgi:glycosyltransferase involved in cell wall biosynthesis